MAQCYAGRPHDDAAAVRAGQRQRSQEQAGGDMAMEGTEADVQHSCSEPSAPGKVAWQQGGGMDGGGMVFTPVRRNPQ
jgi:hypothetical protein